MNYSKLMIDSQIFRKHFSIRKLTSKHQQSSQIATLEATTLRILKHKANLNQRKEMETPQQNSPSSCLH